MHWPVDVVFPAVIGAAQAVLLVAAEPQRHAAVGAELVDQAVAALACRGRRAAARTAASPAPAGIRSPAAPRRAAPAASSGGTAAPIGVPGPVWVKQIVLFFAQHRSIRDRSRSSPHKRQPRPLHGTSFQTYQARHSRASASRRRVRFSSTRRPTPSTAISAFFIQVGGRSSGDHLRHRLEHLEMVPRSLPVQNAITVSSGGQPGTAQATSATRIAASRRARSARAPTPAPGPAPRCARGLFLTEARSIVATLRNRARA